VLAAADLKDALEIGQREEFDILVSDIGLPDGSGLDPIRALAARRPVHAIDLTGFSMDDDLRRLPRGGVPGSLDQAGRFRQARGGDPVDRRLWQGRHGAGRTRLSGWSRDPATAPFRHEVALFFEKSRKNEGLAQHDVSFSCSFWAARSSGAAEAPASVPHPTRNMAP
jgi:CheY-like chemotaxis protein